jgi:tetratricopeptide (TPR) repeat protein
MAKASRKNIPAPAKKAVPATKKVQAKKDTSKKKVNLWLLLALLLPVTFIVYIPVLDNQLTNWDDPTYIIENPLIRQLDWLHIKRIFSEFYFGNYQPLHILSYAIEYHFFKLNPAGYHAVSLVMHMIATALVLWFIYVLSNNAKIAIISALLFGIHPLHVESVAWAAERKDMLYAIFFLLSMIFYLKYIDSESKLKCYFLALLFFILSIFSKAMASSLPPVLILIDYFRARKFNMRLIMEKVPFFVIAIIMGLVSITAAESTDTISHDAVYTFFDRIIFACFNLLAYTGKLILPIHLSSFYPYPLKEAGSLPFYYYIAPFLVTGLFIAIIRSMKSTKVVFFAAGFFVACIFLVLQLLPVGPTIISERYSYVPSIAFFFLLGYGANLLMEKRKNITIPVYVALISYGLFLSIATYNRCDVWKDSLTLWNNVLDQFPKVSVALNNRGNVYGKEMGQLDIALDNFNKSIFYDPKYENAYSNRGIVYCMKGKFDLAIQDFNSALAIKPKYVEALQNRGIAYAQTGHVDKAIADFTAVMQIDKNDLNAYVNRGVAYTQSQQFDKALEDFNKALSIKRDHAEAFYRRSAVYYNMKRYKEAYQDIQSAVMLGFKGDAKYIEQIRKAAEG